MAQFWQRIIPMILVLLLFTFERTPLILGEAPAPAPGPPHFPKASPPLDPAPPPPPPSILPPPPPPTTKPPESKGKGSLTGGQKAGVAIGVLAAAGVVGCAGMVYKKRRHNIQRARFGSDARRPAL